MTCRTRETAPVDNPVEEESPFMSPAFRLELLLRSTGLLTRKVNTRLLTSRRSANLHAGHHLGHVPESPVLLKEPRPLSTQPQGQSSSASGAPAAPRSRRGGGLEGQGGCTSSVGRGKVGARAHLFGDVERESDRDGGNDKDADGVRVIFFADP